MFLNLVLWLSQKEPKLASKPEPFDIWFCVSEAQGVVKSGGLADVAKALPRALQELGQKVKLVLPGYQSAPHRLTSPIILDTELSYWPHTRYQVRYSDLDGVELYYIDCDQYFDRPELYAEHNCAYEDNGERFGFFSAVCLDVLPKLNIRPGIIHSNDWHTALIPFLLKTRYQQDLFYSEIKTVLTIHNALFKGIFSFDELDIIPELHTSGMKHLQYGVGYISTLRAGIAYADKVNAVSPNYAAELLTPLGSHGLVDDFVHRAKDLYGIVNGCDYSEWHPQTDSYLPVNYDDNAASLQQGKAHCKRVLQQALRLPVRPVALFGMVCRLTHQKGFHYLLPIIERFLRNDVQFVIVGTGEPGIAHHLRYLAGMYPDKLAFVDVYSDRYAHWVEASADFFVMPSEFEACGLNQIYSMAYGTLPIVREVGGLKDTVHDYDLRPDKATGFSFFEPSPEALLITLQRALLFYLQSPGDYLQTQQRAMRQDFNWKHSAAEYIKMYQAALLQSGQIN